MTEELLEQMKHIDVKPGDRFVIHCDAPISPDTIDKFGKAWSEFIGDRDNKLLILDKGQTLSVLNFSDEKSEEAKSLLKLIADTWDKAPPGSHPFDKVVKDWLEQEMSPAVALVRNYLKRENTS